jgi:hypothetical protein
MWLVEHSKFHMWFVFVTCNVSLLAHVVPAMLIGTQLYETLRVQVEYSIL